MLNESLGGEDQGFEGRVVTGIVTAIENDLAVIDAAHWATEWPWLPQAAEILRAGLSGRTDNVSLPASLPTMTVSELRTDPWSLHRP